ncbi:MULTISPECIES: phage baseplate assembly protein V [unclassified Variovorax]|uniref:phage baseplate assembly protein V n=1 Tax=unclassified Variovorax TaxID=663243 RepID=UPI003F478F3B
MKEEIQKLWRRMQLVVSRGRITTTDDTGAVQKLQIQIGELETRDTTPRVAEYGFTSNPLAGCHGVLIFVGGDRSNGVIIGTNDQQARLKNLKRGEVAIYDDQGQSVWLKRTGIEINGAGLPIKVYNTPTVRVEADTSVTLATPLVHCTQDLTVDGLLTTLNFTMLAGGAANWGAGGAGTMSFNNMTVTYTGGSIRHNGHRIDDQLRVTNVTAGGANSGTVV